MEPKRKAGDDRAMWRFRPLRGPETERQPVGGWCYVETFGHIGDFIDDVDGSPYEVERLIVTAEEWNAMPEFTGY